MLTESRPALSSLKKNDHLIARGPDSFFYHKNYYPIPYLNNIIRNPETRPVPSKWYRFRLMRQDGVVTVLLNRQRSDWDKYGDVPVIVWHDDGDWAGAVPAGTQFSLRQQGTGYWRDIRIWSAQRPE